MADFNVSKYAALVIFTIIALILVVNVLIPIISTTTIPDTVPMAGALNSLIGIAPLLLIVLVIMIIVGALVLKRE